MVNLSTRQAARFSGLFAAKDSPIAAQFLRYPGGVSKWAKIRASLAAIRPLREGVTDWRRFVHDFWEILAESWSTCRFANRPAFRGYLRLRIPQSWLVSKVPRRGVKMG